MIIQCNPWLLQLLSPTVKSATTPTEGRLAMASPRQAAQLRRHHRRRRRRCGYQSLLLHPALLAAPPPLDRPQKAIDTMRQHLRGRAAV